MSRRIPAESLAIHVGLLAALASPIAGAIAYLVRVWASRRSR